PPLPPDDPESHKLMHRVDGKKGYKHWHDWGDTKDLQNPLWQAYLPLDEHGVLVLDDRMSVKLALLHSPDYQRLLEQLYLSALDVSFERFRFDTQFFGGYAVDSAVEGSTRNDRGEYQQVLAMATHNGPPVESDVVRNGGIGLKANRLFTTGSTLVVDFANSVMWQFSGSGSEFATTTLLDFSLVQPLLRGAGRNRVMERLTLTERTLLANVRQMERYRQGFYVQIMTGRDPGTGPSRRGGVFGAGLEGFTGVGSGFGGLAGGGTGGGGVISGGGTGAGQAGGFLGLLQGQQEIFNQEDNLNDLRWNYLQLLFTLQELLRTKPYQNSDVVRQRLQVAQARQAILNAESRLVNADANYLVLLDRFKLLLGLPPQICVKIDRGMLERVNLIDPAIRPIRKQLSELQTKVGDKILAILPQGDEPMMTWSEKRADGLRELKDLLNEVEQTRRQLMDGEEAQIRRVRVDGLKLGGQLNDTLKQAIERGASNGQAGAEVTALGRDLALLTGLRLAIERDEDWAPELRHWKQVQDAVANVERLQQQLTKGTDLDLSWMRTDANPVTRDLYQRYRVRVQTLSDTPLEQRPPLLQQLRTAVTADTQPLMTESQQLRANNGWPVQLDAWRTVSDESEAEGQTQAVEIRRFRRLFAQFAEALADAPEQFNALPGQMRTYQDRIDALVQEGPTLTPQALTDRFRQEISPAIPQRLGDLANQVLDLSLVQARLRTETVALVPVDLHPDAALEIARANRLDWMNARASLVDTWRLIQFNANSLKSGLDVVFSGDIKNSGNNPLNLDPATGRLRVGLAFDAPLTRLAERNTYRQSLIEYQQARRAYYRYEDSVSRELREILRIVQANQRNLDIRRQALRTASEQVGLNYDLRDLLALPKAGTTLAPAPAASVNPTAARDAVQALTDLLNAQNDFLSVWISYEVLRRALDFGLGTLQLDADGVWVDPGPIGPQQGYPGLGEEGDCWPGKMVLPDVPDEEIPAPIPDHSP
ncbi:MAG: TolC family protein, partial [Planctomycetota bacterium]|nr:TolC family protein [Planctomycetota bacterium]